MESRVPAGEAYDIPLRCLIPPGVEHLLAAGRCISATHEALSSCRIMPACMATGVCAALAAASNQTRVQCRINRYSGNCRGKRRICGTSAFEVSGSIPEVGEICFK